MSTSIIPFQFQDREVRVVDVDGEPWFVASDVAKILGYRDAANLTRRLDADDRGTRSVSTPSGDQLMTVVTEPGLYASILGSHVPGAQQFKRWVTREVLPQIRRTGSYGMVRELTGPELMARALIEADSTIKAQAAELEAARPKVEIADRFLDADSDYSVRDAANALTRAGVKVGERRLFTALAEYGWIYRAKGDGKWRPYRARIESGHLSVIPQSHYHPKTGVLVLDAPQVRITPKGMQVLMQQHGVESFELQGVLA